MKRTILIIAIALFSGFMLRAQHVAYIESENILAQLPEYQKAKTELDNQSDAWKQEVENKLKEVDQLYKKYVAEESILSQTAKQTRQNEIIEAEKKAKDFKDSKFGPDGEFSKLEKARMEPVYDKLQKAVEAAAEEAGYAYVFDKSAATNWLYTSKTYDISDLVLKKLTTK